MDPSALREGVKAPRVDDGDHDRGWPIEFDAHAFRIPVKDPWVSLVRSFIQDFRRGDRRASFDRWDDDVTWIVPGQGPMAGEHHGTNAIVDYHEELRRRSGGTFRQQLISLEAGGGPIVEGHLRTIAQRPPRSLDLSTLLVFELAGGRLRRVTELPGDPRQWDAFWAD
ncbi:MAG TPA: nuclear transport factor 2 family protein [Candidatus Saccharimonadales bacterium]|nr:nuclear transport factor 2 family protein [Candidatus Saccharimonadales bacterium]